MIKLCPTSGNNDPTILANAPWHRFAAIGDTFTALLKAPSRNHRRRSWTDQVAAALKQQQPDLAYLNLCKPNLVSSQARAQQLSRMLEFSPDLAAVACGYDDILSESFDIGHFEGELTRIMTALRQIDCAVLTIGLIDITRPDVMPAARRRQIRDHLDLICARTAAIAMRFGAINVDLSEHVAQCNIACSDDGRRLNSHGHAMVAAATISQLGLRLRSTAS